MEILTPGNKYKLQNHDQPQASQELQFIERKLEQSKVLTKEARPPKIVTAVDGVSASEVLQALVDRLGFSYSRFNTIQILLAAHHCELALAQLRDLEAGLKAQGIENAPLP